MQKGTTTDLEVWRDIVGYEGIYEISTAGRIRRKYKTRSRFMQPFTREKKKSRRFVNLTDAAGIKKQYPVAKLVAKTFLSQPEGTVAYHKNGVLSDDWVGNITFSTQEELGKTNGGKSRRKPVAKIDRSGEIVEIYPSAAQAAKINYISEQCVKDRCNGWQNRHGDAVKLKSLFAPDGYAYAWAEDQRDIERTVRKIESSQQANTY